MKHSRIDVLFEDNHLLVINKPAGIATMGVAADRPSAITAAKEYLKVQYNKPGNVYLGVVSRLDLLVSGVLIFARTSKAAARLTEQFRDRSVKKTYWAIVEGLTTSAGTLNHWLRHNDAAHRVDVARPNTPGASQAILHFERLRCIAANSVLQVELDTGRKHQIRVQLSASGHPILGDAKYGSRGNFGGVIALHSKQLSIEHPTTRERLDFVAPLPHPWLRAGVTDITV